MVPNKAASATVLCGMVQLRDQMTRSQLKLGTNLDNGRHCQKSLKSGNHVPMLTSEATHGQSKKSNAGVRTSQHTNHGNVPKKEKNASVMEDGQSMVPRLEPTRKSLTSSELLSYLWLSLVLTERDPSNVMLLHSMVLIQLQMLTKHASVIKRRNSSINHLFLLPRLSGSHLNLNPKLKVSLREPLSTPVKLLR